MRVATPPSAAYRHAALVVEAAAALILTAMTFGRAEMRGLLAALLGGLGQALAGLPSLVAVDPPTAGDAAVLALSLLAIVLPALRFFYHAPRIRLVWVPLWLSVLTLLSAAYPLGMDLTEKRVALVLFAVAGWILAARRHGRWVAFLPIVVAAHPTMTTHGGALSDRIWSPSRLAPRCAENDGARPSNFSIEKATPHHYAVTPVSDDLIVMTGERGSYRLRRDEEGRFAFDGSLEFSANLWQGSLGEGWLFFTHRGSGLVSVPVSELEGAAKFRRQQIPSLPGARPELDLLDAVYEPTTRSVFLSELVRGGAWEVSLADGSMRHHELHALYLQLVRRNLDEMLVGISTVDLLVFDPRRKVVTERLTAAIGAAGVDVCQEDGSAVVADYAGRLRLFALDSSGRYRFEQGVALSSPRRVAFSPDCEWIAVTSADDETAYVLRRNDLSKWRTFHMGPGLRDVVYTGRREVAIVDACTVNILPGGES